ncbi:MAG: tetratricopeptide repeat protein [Sphaerospermopsis sp. SIO1G2]|nr:tetratricopeptide repeat protein [Sphaerospermopsis sp. SIO1G1]NET72799.1 tetratricopeptide repeat protein [Sphaerospermopsis sp. SIO1G2]
MNYYSFLDSRTLQDRLPKSNYKIGAYTKTKEERNKESAITLDKNFLRSCALRLASEGDYTEAIALLNQLIDSDQNAIDYNNRGLVFFQSGDHEQALRDYNTAIELNPHLATVYNNRANCYAADGDLIAALADYDQALDLHPHYVRAWINRGITLRDLGEYSAAIDNFETALLFGQLEANLWAELGRTCHLWGDWNLAIAYYYRSLAHISSFDSQDVSSYRLRLQLENWLEELMFGSKTDY